MSRKHKRTASEMIIATRIAPVGKTEAATYDRNPMRSFQHKFDETQEEIRTAPIRALVQEQSAALRQLIQNDIPALYSGESSFLAATCPQVGDCSQFNGISPDGVHALIRRVFSTFCDEIASQGQLTEGGKQKLQRLAQVNRECDPSQVSTWHQMFYLLRAADELIAEDFIPTPAPQPQEPTESFDDVLESNDSFSREGRKKIAVAAMQSMSIECRQMYDAFYDSLVRNFQHYLTDEETKRVAEFMQKYNLNFLRPADWDRARVCLVRAGLLPENLIYPQEALCEAIENTNAPLSDYSVRQDFARRARLLNQ